MARPLRIHLKNGWYHVTARGNNRQAIFLDDRDRRHFLDLVAEMIDRHALELHAFVLMDNHYHLVVRTPQANLSAAIQWLNVAYSLWWNRRHGRTGHVFQGRFKAVVVESGQWVLTCSLYVHLNPVAVAALELGKQAKAAEGRGRRRAERAVVAARLERLRTYRWSSYRAYVGYESPPDWLTLKDLLARAGSREQYRQGAEAKVGQGLKEALWTQLHWGLVLGGQRFAERVREQLGVTRESSGRRALQGRRSWAEVVRAVEQIRGEPWTVLAARWGDPALALALSVARRCTGLTLRALGQAAGGRDYTAVGMAIKRFEQRLAKNPALRQMTERVLEKI